MQNKLSLLLLLLFGLGHPSLFGAGDSLAPWRFGGALRYYALYNRNAGPLQSWRGQALGLQAQLRWQPSAAWQFQAALYSTYSLEPLPLPRDERTGAGSRYAVGLVSIEEKARRYLVIPGKLWGHFERAGHQIKLGRWVYDSPLINGQDGRMLPTFVEGLQYRYQQGEHRWRSTYINRIAPRAGSAFYQPGASLGTVSGGRHAEGSPVDFDGEHAGAFVWVNAYHYDRENWELEFWSYYAESIMHSLYLRSEQDWPLRRDWELYSGQSWIRQDALLSKVEGQYFDQEHSESYAARLGLRHGEWSYELAYSYVGHGGRFLFPREWGRQEWYTPQKRERSEGLAEAQNLLIRSRHEFAMQKGDRLVAELAAGSYWWPEADDAARNKYGVPAHYQFTVDVLWEFQHWLRGLEAEFLFSYHPAHESLSEWRYQINRVDHQLYHLILNYHF